MIHRLKKRIARRVMTWIGQTYDEPGLDCTSHAHPAWSRGWQAACTTASREILMLTQSRMSHGQLIKALNRFARNLSEHGREEDKR